MRDESEQPDQQPDQTGEEQGSEAQADKAQAGEQCVDGSAAQSTIEPEAQKSEAPADSGDGSELQCLSGIDETADRMIQAFGHAAEDVRDEPAPEDAPEAHDLATLEKFRDGVLNVAKRGPKPVKWIATGVQHIIEFSEKTSDEQLELSNKLLRKSPSFVRRFLEWAIQLGE